MAQIIKLNLSEDDYVELAQEVFEAGDSEKSITYLKKALSLNKSFSKASIALSGVYSSIGLPDLSNTVLYQALYQKPTPEYKDRILTSLAFNFLELNMTDVAEYYLRDYADQIDFPFSDDEIIEFDDVPERCFRLVYPKGDDYYANIIHKAYELGRQGKFDDAIGMLDEIDVHNKYRDMANHVALVCMMIKNDLDGAIDNAKRMLCENGDNLSVKCTLATAYLMEDREDDAAEVLQDILKKDYGSIDEILLLLPLLVNMNVHYEVVKYTERVMNMTEERQQNVMLWLGQGLYNIGKFDDARRVMLRIKNIYGELSPAAYYISYFDSHPKNVAYSISLPLTERVDRFNKVKQAMSLRDIEFARALSQNDNGIRDLLEWTILEGNDEFKQIVASKIGNVRTDYAEEFLRRQLIASHLDFNLMSNIIWSLAKFHMYQPFTFDVVAQDRYKSIDLSVPVAYHLFPRALQSAVRYCVCDIVFTDEEPNLYLDVFVKLINSLAFVDEKGELKYATPELEKVGRFRNVRTLAGVLLCKVYEDDYEDQRESTIERYNLDAHTFDKYYGIVFGGGNGQQKD